MALTVVLALLPSGKAARLAGVWCALHRCLVISWVISHCHHSPSSLKPLTCLGESPSSQWPLPFSLFYVLPAVDNAPTATTLCVRLHVWVFPRVLCWLASLCLPAQSWWVGIWVHLVRWTHRFLLACHSGRGGLEPVGVNTCLLGHDQSFRVSAMFLNHH